MYQGQHHGGGAGYDGSHGQAEHYHGFEPGESYQGDEDSIKYGRMSSDDDDDRHKREEEEEEEKKERYKRRDDEKEGDRKPRKEEDHRHEKEEDHHHEKEDDRGKRPAKKKKTIEDAINDAIEAEIDKR